MIIKNFLYKTTDQNAKPTSGFSPSIQQLHIIFIILIRALYDRAEETSPIETFLQMVYTMI